MNKNGFTLLATLLGIFCLLSIALGLHIQIFNRKSLEMNEYKKLSVYYAARGGLAYGNYQLQSPSWHTDTQYPGSENLIKWLLQDSTGTIIDFQKGKIKIIKIAGQPELYSIGFIGNNLTSAQNKIILKETEGKIEIL